jgi:tetratricopeptide (TPR) repeat protein
MDGLGLSSEDTALDRARPTGELAPSDQNRVQRTEEGQVLAELAVAEQAYGPESLQLLPALVKLSTVRVGRGEAERAAPLVLRALDIGERYPADRPELVLLLTDLTRLCMKQSAYTLAEPLLLRLVEMKRGKGDDHPEVATVLASLATVRQALGQHESAEQLWRRVLVIREKTLAPNHFAVATAIERLADSCAARGKFNEAMQLFKRAQAMREVTLGASHASLRVLRERVADLELQSSEELFEPVDQPPAFTFTGPPVPKLAPQMVPRSVSIAAAAAAPREKYAAPIAPVLTADFTSSSGGALTVADPSAPAAPTGVAAYRDLVLSIQKDLEDEDAESQAPNPLTLAYAAVAKLVANRRKALAVAGGAVVVLLLGLAADSRAGTEPGAAADTPPSRALAPAPRATATITTIPAGTPSVVAKQPNETVRSALSSFIASARSRSSESKTEKRSEERDASPPKVVIPKVSQSILAHADSVARSIKAPGSTLSDAVSVERVAASSHAPLYNAEQDANSGPSRARLIGAIPTPRLPDQLSDIQALVKVWVKVDTLGRPVMSTFSIDNSPSPLLTATLKRVITDLRFEPARSGGPNARAMPDSVQVGFNFGRSR